MVEGLGALDFLGLGIVFQAVLGIWEFVQIIRM